MNRFGRRQGVALPGGGGLGSVDFLSSDTVSQNSEQRSFLRSLKLAHWILLLYPIFLFSIKRQRELEELYTIDTSAMLQIIANGIFGFYAIMLFVRYLPTFKKRLFIRPNVWFSFYIFLAILSFIWSDRPAYTLYRAVEVFIYLILIFYTIISFDTFEDMVKFQLLWGIILVVFWHFLDIRSGISLEIMHNSLVPGTLIGIVFLGWTLKGFIWRLSYVLILLSVILSTSSATYLSLILGMGIVLIFRKGKVRFLAVMLIIFITVFIMFYGINYLDIVFWGKSEQNVQTASGRIPVWKWVIEEIVPKKPIVGYSFGQGESISRIFDVSYKGFRVIHMHNIAISSLVNLGIIGFFFLLMLLSDTLKCALKLKDFKWRAYVIAGLIAILFNALSISSITAPLSFGWIGHTMFFCMVAILFINKQSTITASKKSVRYSISW